MSPRHLLFLGILLISFQVVAQRTPPSLAGVPDPTTDTIVKLEPDGTELPVTVVKAISGHVLLLDSGTECRLLGVISPAVGGGEAQAEFFGEEARTFTHNLVQNRELNLTFDRRKSEAGGRWLAYAWLPDGTSLNERVIAEGIGVMNRKDKVNPDYKEAFETAESAAHDQKLGIWKDTIKAQKFLEDSVKSPSVRPAEQIEGLTVQPGTGAQPFRPESGQESGNKGRGGPQFRGGNGNSNGGYTQGFRQGQRPGGWNSNRQNQNSYGQYQGVTAPTEKEDNPRVFRSKVHKGADGRYYRDQPFFAPGILKPRRTTGNTSTVTPGTGAEGTAGSTSTNN